MVGSKAPLRFCGEDKLRYASVRRVFGRGDRLVFDDAYRPAHLPLLAPGHPRVLRELPGHDYRDGIYAEPRYALVVPVCSEALMVSPAFQAFDRAQRSASFAPKIAWTLGQRRASLLHGTVVGRLSRAEGERCAAAVGRALVGLGPLPFRLGGPFIGNKNLGRIYFPIYPQEIGSEDAFALIQDAAAAARTGFYGVGYYNFIDEFDPAETAELTSLMERWGPRTFAEMAASTWEVHVTNDDLVPSGRSFITIDGQTGTLTRHS